MDITTNVLNTEPNRPVTPNPVRPTDTVETGFAQSIQDAARQAEKDQTAAGIPPRSARTPAAESTGMQAAAPVTPGTLGLRETAQELQNRQLLNSMAGRLATPGNIADYPQTAVTYAGQLAAQVNHAGFALPDVSARPTASTRRGPDARAVKPVDAPEEGSGVETTYGREP